MSTENKKPFVLIICDGWGYRADEFGNAIAAAATPRLDALFARWPHTTVAASGEAVGLPAGQIGNSEVGHLTIGAGRILHQPLSRQQQAIASGIFYENETLIAAIELAKSRGTALHILGLVSPGGVHSHSDGALALVRLAKKLGLDRVHIHAFTDGRDTPPTSALQHIEEFEAALAEVGTGRIASLSGRYYAMDRDNRWERIQEAYEVLVGSQGHRTAPTAREYVAAGYDRGETDEFLRPVPIASTPEDHTPIRDGDAVVFFNFRPDRAIQISRALVEENFTEFPRSRVVHNLHFVAFAEYDKHLGVPVAFPKEDTSNTLAEVISEHGGHQYHIAETEKYAHVTYFLNGGREKPFAGEKRTVIPSLKIATYDLEPAMRAEALTIEAEEAVRSGDYDCIIINYANADMVGHTGDFEATKHAISVLDDCVGRLIDTTVGAGGIALMTADHGNAEEEIDATTNQPITAHSANPVPVLLCGSDVQVLRTGGGLSDIAPTVLSLMSLPAPSAMTGRNLAE